MIIMTHRKLKRLATSLMALIIAFMMVPVEALAAEVRAIDFDEGYIKPEMTEESEYHEHDEAAPGHNHDVAIDPAYERFPSRKSGRKLYVRRHIGGLA